MTADDRRSLDNREKLVQRKQEWARDSRLLTEEADAVWPRERLPPGQRLIEKWPVLDLGVQPDIPRDKWIPQSTDWSKTPIRWKWMNLSLSRRSNCHPIFIA